MTDSTRSSNEQAFRQWLHDACGCWSESGEYINLPKLRVMDLFAKARAADEPSVLGGGCGVPPMPTVTDAIEAHVRQIEQLCDAANIDPSQWLIGAEPPPDRGFATESPPDGDLGTVERQEPDTFSGPFGSVRTGTCTRCHSTSHILSQKRGLCPRCADEQRAADEKIGPA